MSSGAIPDYVAIGHFTIDRSPAGDALGGTALYAAVTAARFGLRVGVLTRGNIDGLPQALREEFAELAGSIEFIVESSQATTIFENREVAGRRVQALHGWAGPIDLNGMPPGWRSAPIVHLAPVARDFDARQLGRISPDYLGMTPQGWVRTWTEESLGTISQTPLRLPTDLLARMNGLVVSADEYAMTREAFEAVGRNGLAVVTRGRKGATVLDRGRPFEVPGYPAERIDTTGAGDVFAAVLFLMRAQLESTASSLRHASAAAALSVSGHGLAAVPTRAAVEHLIAVEQSRPH